MAHHVPANPIARDRSAGCHHSACPAWTGLDLTAQQIMTPLISRETTLA
jgi:hypothetical protein